ncbi:MAG: Hsp20/alpha crystallin family protein [Fidelibacterota bacterium]
MWLTRYQPRSLWSLFDDLLDWRLPTRTSDFVPYIDVVEEEKEFVVTAELPGLKKNDFSVKIEDDHLVIRGEKKYEHEEKEKNYYHSERRYGSFCRSFHLGEGVEKDKIKAQYKNGVLRVTIPKSKVSIKTEKEIKIE